MNLQHRKELLVRLGNYIVSDNPDWEAVKYKAFLENKWFIPEFIDLAVQSISKNFLSPDKIDELISYYSLPLENKAPKKVGIVMAGNIPLVGFHDFFSVFITGNKAVMKPSTKDDALIKHIGKMLVEWEPEADNFIQFSELLKNCDAYIATGSNNTGRYFEYYFSKYPHIIRKNRTSVAVLTGEETTAELEHLADDVYLYFGLGCRNVTKLYVPRHYNFEPLINAFKKYNHLFNHDKFKNNFDYNLAMHLLNNKYYMTDGSILLIEDEATFSPISQVNYEFYDDETAVNEALKNNEKIQCTVSNKNIKFGHAQAPGLFDFADNIDTIKFLLSLN